jgi:hypothetical protein
MFLMENKGDLEEEYPGRYVAIVKRKVVAVGRSVAEVYATLANLKVKNPLVTYIPKEGEEALLI